VDCKAGKLRIGLAIRPLWTAILTETTVLGAVIYAMSIPSGAFLFSCAYFGRRFKCYLYLMRYQLINTSTRTRPEQYCTGEPARTTNKCPRMIAVRNHSIRTVRKLVTNVTRTIQDDVDDGSTPMCARLDPALVQQTLYVQPEYCMDAYSNTRYSQIHSHFFHVIFWILKSMYDHSCSIMGAISLNSSHSPHQHL
jgi:hypothetical protein